MYADMPTGTYENAQLELVKVFTNDSRVSCLPRPESSILCTVGGRPAKPVEAYAWLHR